MNIDWEDLYHDLFEHYQAQGWWPLLDLNDNQSNPTNRGIFTGYHPSEYDFPKNDDQKFEIMIGAILTQNTTWGNAEKGLMALKTAKALTPQRILLKKHEDIAELIRSSGYFNQKAERIKLLAEFVVKNPIQTLQEKKIEDLRKVLLKQKGIGPETADSILLYAFKKPIFVIDAYSKRLYYRLGLISDFKIKYLDLQKKFHKNISLDVEIYNEFHALIVQHCALICKKRPLCEKCFLSSKCPMIMEPKLKKKKRKKKNEEQGE